MNSKIKLLLMALMLATTTFHMSALDPDECGKARGRFTNLAFVYNHMDQPGMPKLHSDIGFAFTKGNTYYLHRPIAGCLRFGIDAGWMDLAYDNFKVEEYYKDFSEPANAYDIHHIDIGMQLGVSATVNLFRYFQANAYFRYNPTMVMMYNDDEMQAGFANMVVPGVSVTYGRVGVGVEGKFGSTKLKSYFADDDYEYEDGDSWTDAIGTRRQRVKLSGVRAYLTFRF